jgi:hypothetical protein
VFVRVGLRILRVILLTILLIICAASVALWIRSYRQADLLAYIDQVALPASEPDVRKNVDTNWNVRSTAGVIFIEYSRTAERSDVNPRILRVVPVANGWHYRTYSNPTADEHASYRLFNVLGFEIGWLTRDAPRSRSVVRAVRLPYWMLFAISAMVPAIAAHRRFRRHVVVPGRCATCGYDLRATPDRCPECGTVVASSESVPSAR